MNTVTAIGIIPTTTGLWVWCGNGYISLSRADKIFVEQIQHNEYSVAVSAGGVFGFVGEYSNKDEARGALEQLMADLRKIPGT